MFKTLKAKLILFFILTVAVTVVCVGFFLMLTAPDPIEIWQNLIPALILGIIFAVLLSLILSNIVMKPIANLTEKTEAFISEEFHHDFNIATKDEIGKLTKIFNQMNEIIKVSLLQISSEKNKVETILENMTDGILAFNTEQQLIHVNHTAKDLLNLKNDNNVLFDEYFKSLYLPVCMGDFLYLDNFMVDHKEIEINGKTLKTSFVPFRLEGPKVAGVIVILQDITEMLKLENARREFVADVSHELKTPITTIRTYIETLQDGAILDKKTARSFLKTIDSEAARMNRLVKDLLSLSTFDSPQFKLQDDVFYLPDLVSEVVNNFNVEAEKKGQILTYEKTSEIIGEICADREKIKQVLVNVISNALKYTAKDGKIEVFTGEPYSGAYIKVRDNGLGIPEKDLPHVFDRFYRVDKARTRDTGGTGLGLSIAKEIIEKHGGTIKIDSRYGEYTEVTIALPKIKRDEVDL